MLVNKRVDIDNIRYSIDHYSSIFEEKKFIVIVDFDFFDQKIATIDVRTSDPNILNHYNADNYVFIYGVDQDDLGLPFIKWLTSRSIKYYAALLPHPATFLHKDINAREVIEEEFSYQVENNFAKFDFGFGDFENICQALDTTRNIKGSFVEVGCFQGSSGSVALGYMKKSEIFRPSFFLDVFDGFNYTEAKTSSDAIWNGGHVTDGMSAVEARLARYADPARGRPVYVCKNNIITDELPGEIGSIAVANLDVDMFEAVHAGLLRLAPRIVPGGILIVEDPGHTPMLIGAQLALEMFLESPAAERFTKIYMHSGQYFLIKSLD